MLGRYQMKRGRRAPDDPLPTGERQDTRRHTRHPLRPEAAAVDRYLDAPSDAAWETFSAEYRRVLGERFERDSEPFDRFAELAREGDVWLGCSCPTARNPDVRRCHTFLALGFMEERYTDLVIRWPV